MNRTKKHLHQMTIADWEKAFPTEESCKGYLVAHRWPLGVKCPRCDTDVTYEVSTMAFKWQCYTCTPDSGYRFSVIAGTIFENTNKPLQDWFRVIHMMLTSKKGVAALEVHRVIGTGSYETAWSMCHRIRAGMADEGFRKLVGVVEVDETFVGGKAKNRHIDKRGGGGGTGGVGSGKSVVAGAVRRKGGVIARVVKNVRADTLTRFVREAVSHKVSLLCTDQWVGYKHLGDEFPHEMVDHMAGEYVVGAIHTNTIEGFWSLIKRGMVGTFHKVSAKYLPLYVVEFQFRYNNRMNADIFGEAIRGC